MLTFNLLNISMIDYSAFSHGQIQSKIWLCENLEPLLPPTYSQVAIIGSWYNVLGLMLLTRNQEKYNLIMGIDKEEESVEIANKIVNGWSIGMDFKARNTCADIKGYNLNSYNVVINTSCEHMNNDWFQNVNPYQLLCLQTSNMVTDDPSWNVTNPNPTMDDFKKKYPLSQILFEGEKVFDYGHLRYSRYMMIGRL
jgi:hypothetical protein